MRLAFRMALKFLLSAKAQTTLIIIGIAVGISVQLFIGLLIQGLQQDLIESTIGSSSQVTITNDDDYIEIEDMIIEDILAVEGINKVSPVLTKNVFITIDDDSTTVVINGITYEDSSNIYKLDEKLVEGDLPLNNDEIIIGNFYDVEIGDEIEITTIENGDYIFTVSGIFDSGVLDVNEKIVYTNLNSLQNYLNLDNEVSAIETQIDDVFDNEITSKVESVVDSNYQVVSWQDENADLLSALSSQSLSSYIIQICVVVSVALAISSVLIISVVQKSKQIGILKAMGLNNSGISQVFLFQGALLGAIGSLFGIALGLGLLISFTTFAVDDSGDAVISIYYNYSFIGLSFLIGVVCAVGASIIPARKSKKLSAIEVISNG